jgi:hypothetical protein
LLLAGCLATLWPASTLLGKDEQYKATLDFGYRWNANFKGSEDLYRSHLDYGEGPKLFSGAFLLSAPQGSNKLFDRFELRLNSWGGEPHNSASLRASKAGVYELRFDYRNIHYFNSVPSFANPFFGSGNLASQHRFDISQRLSSLELRLRPGKRISPYVALEQTRRWGPGRTTLRDGGDEFLLRADHDNGSTDFRAGVNIALAKLSLLLEQGFRHYRDETSLTASGLQPGNTTRLFLGRDLNLSEYNGKYDTGGNIPFSTAIAQFQPIRSLLLRGKVSYSMASLNPYLEDRATGNFFSLPLSAFYTGRTDLVTGRVKKPSLFGDFQAEWHPHQRFRLIERVTIHRFHVSGAALSNAVYLNVDPLLEAGLRAQVKQDTPFNTLLAMDYRIQELQGVVGLTSRLALRVGHRYEQKEVTLGDTYRLSRNVLIAGLSYDFSSRNRIAAEYEVGKTDQPILRTDVVDYQRFRLRGRFSPSRKLEFNGSATLFDHESDIADIDFTSRTRDYDLQFTYNLVSRVSVSGEYERSRIRTNILYILPQTFTWDRFRYQEKGNFGHLFLNFTLVHNSTLSLGYSVLGTVGNFPVNYHRPSARVDIPLHERFAVYGQWNYYDYNEKLAYLPQDYRTHLAVLGFRISLDKP